MTPERWRKVESIYQSVMEREPGLRSAYLAEVCKDDSGLRREVESLLRLNSSSVLVDQPAWQAVGELLDNVSGVAAGTQLGPYRIEGVLGAGGMGQVYSARDVRLDRVVAIKVSKEEFNERFEREARAVAALNHPNICSLYDVGPNYLVMELVEGPTLADRIKEGAIPLEEALRIARQIADALEAAHHRGIVHRDLKPGNIKIKPDGTVKVLDFGLAKRAPAGTPPANPEDSPTITGATGVGVILGTAAYMSPEQARGHAVDKRTDIWAFGVVLHEMLAGQQLFAGATITDTLAALLTKEPDWSKTPLRARRLLAACLEKDPKRRLHDIADVWHLLEEPAHALPKQRAVLPWTVALTTIIAMAALGVFHYQTTRPIERRLMRLDLNLGPDDLETDSSSVILSPDGTRVVFVSRSPNGQTSLQTRRLDQPHAGRLPGTENGYSPFFSPDGQWVAFFDNTTLKKIRLEGGPPVTLCDARNGAGGSWGDDGQIVAALSGTSGLSRVSSSGGTPVPLTQLDGSKRETTHRWPQILPRSKAVLFTAATGIGFDEARIEVQSLETGQRKTLHQGGMNARYLDSGHLVWVHQGALLAAPMDPERLELMGPAALVMEDVTTSPRGKAQFDVSSAGTAVYRSGQDFRRSLTIRWLDSTGETRPLLAKPARYVYPTFAPDGKRLALALAGDLWVYEWELDRMLRLTNTPDLENSPVWSPDGRHIAFGGLDGIWWARGDGSGEPRRITDGATNFYTSTSSGINQLPRSFTPDGKRLAYASATRGGWDMWTVSLEEERSDHPKTGKPTPLLESPANEVYAAFSPDGRWLAYQSDESGKPEIYVRSFPGGASEGKSLVSTGGGKVPVWSRHGREIFYLSLDNRIMVTGYSVKGDVFVPNKTRPWSEIRFVEDGPLRTFDLAPDGKRFAILIVEKSTVAQTPSGQVAFLLNFFDELRRRAPSR